MPASAHAAGLAVDSIRPGVVVDSVHASSDTSQTYALYLPRGYDRTSHWPVLFLLDPRGRAINALLNDAQSKFSVDVHRFYFVGFSGTGRLAWNYGYSIPENVAGLIEVGDAHGSTRSTPTPYVPPIR